MWLWCKSDWSTSLVWRMRLRRSSPYVKQQCVTQCGLHGWFSAENWAASATINQLGWASSWEYWVKLRQQRRFSAETLLFTTESCLIWVNIPRSGNQNSVFAFSSSLDRSVLRSEVACITYLFSIYLFIYLFRLACWKKWFRFVWLHHIYDKVWWPNKSFSV